MIYRDKTAGLPASDGELTFSGVTKAYGDKVIYDRFDLTVGHETTAILGRSGCGKTTLLNLIAGTVRPDAGAVTGQGRVAYVFQTPRLIPHLTVLKNLTYAGIDGQAARDMLARCGVDGRLYPNELSGGMAQRVGLARAFAARADTVLMDEPFKSLDLGLKTRLLALTSELCAPARVALVTHDPAEAEVLAARALVVDGGRVIYDRRKTNGTFPGLTDLLRSL